MPNNVIAENNDLGGCLTLTGTTPGVLWRLAHGWSRCCGRWLGSIAWGIVGGPALAQWREPYSPAQVWLGRQGLRNAPTEMASRDQRCVGVARGC